MRGIVTLMILGWAPSALSRPITTTLSASIAADISAFASAVSHHNTIGFDSSGQLRTQGSALASIEPDRRAGMDDYLWLSSSVHAETTTLTSSAAEPSQDVEHHDRHELARNTPEHMRLESRDRPSEGTGRDEDVQKSKSKEATDENGAVVKKRTKVWRRRARRRRAHP
ncbi:hypothetical protein IAT40_003489 [Kwoniella sp. CBS 6097]